MWITCHMLWILPRRAVDIRATRRTVRASGRRLPPRLDGPAEARHGALRASEGMWIVAT